MMYASLKDELFKQRVDYIVGELARCQQARKTGYVGAIPKKIRSSGSLQREKYIHRVLTLMVDGALLHDA